MKNILFHDSIYRIYREATGELFIEYKDSCKYRVANNETSIIEYLCAKIAEVSEEK